MMSSLPGNYPKTSALVQSYAKPAALSTTYPKTALATTYPKPTGLPSAYAKPSSLSASYAKSTALSSGYGSKAEQPKKPKRKRNRSEIGPDGQPKKKRKRGIKNEKLYKRNEVRMARLKGQPYVSYTGKLVEGKVTPSHVVCKCRSKCHAKLLEKNINELWNHFYSIDNKNAQDTHLQNWIEVREIKRRKRKKRIPLEINLVEGSHPVKLTNAAEHTEGGDQNDTSNGRNEDNEDFDEGDETEASDHGDHSEQNDTNDHNNHQEHNDNESAVDADNQVVVRDESQLIGPQTFRKNYTFIYNVRVNGRITQICKNAFLQVFGVTESRIRRICDLLVHSKIPCDLRGKNRSVNTIEPDVRAKIQAHILTFHVREIFHEGKTKKYLDPGLNIVKMHDMFIRDHPELQNKVKYSFYYQYFKENFDYEFGQPQQNQPEPICPSYENLHPEVPVPLPAPAAVPVPLPVPVPAVSDVNNDNQIQTPELQALKKRAKDFYEALKHATDTKDYDTLALAFNCIQNFLVPQHQPSFSYNNYYYHHQQPQDPGMLEWNNHHQNHQ